MIQDHQRTINFGSGPAALPDTVLKQAAEAILDYRGSGLSILGIPHRGSLFDEILAESKQLVLELAGLDSSAYEVLWLQGGGRLQFAMIPMNFLDQQATAGYIDSGYWAHDALSHAQQFGNVLTLASSRSVQYTKLPVLQQPIPGDLAYVHLTTNNTIYGTQLKEAPDSTVPLIADMSSDIFSQQRDYSRYDLFYAVAQKNIGPAGATLVVLRKSLLERIVRQSPPALDYRQQVLHGSVFNTPPVFAIYVSLLTLRWTKEKTIAALEQANRKKAELLYLEIERNSLFEPIVSSLDRSMMNVVFRAITADTEKAFLTCCRQHRIEGIGGHRTVGGFRVSLYNAISVEQVQYLVTLMQEFEQNNQ